jgi:hypothetical protein
VDHVVLERRGVDGNDVHRAGFFRVDGPWQLAAVDDEDLVVAAQLAEAGAGHVGEFHFRVLRGGRAFGALDDVLASAAGRLGHLVVLAALGVVKFLGRLTMVVRQEPPTETQRFQLHEGGQRERMQLPESAVFIKKLGHGGVGVGWRTMFAGLGTLLTGLTGLTVSMASTRSAPSFLLTWSSSLSLTSSLHSSPEKARCSSDFFNASSAASLRV